MPLDYAKAFLGASRRNSLDHRMTGESDVEWTRDERKVATGYFSSSEAGVVVHATKQFVETEFRGDDARKLEYVGQREESAIHR